MAFATNVGFVLGAETPGHAASCNNSACARTGTSVAACQPVLIQGQPVQRPVCHGRDIGVEAGHVSNTGPDRVGRIGNPAPAYGDVSPRPGDGQPFAARQPKAAG